MNEAYIDSLPSDKMPDGSDFVADIPQPVMFVSNDDHRAFFINGRLSHSLVALAFATSAAMAAPLISPAESEEKRRRSEEQLLEATKDFAGHSNTDTCCVISMHGPQACDMPWLNLRGTAYERAHSNPPFYRAGKRRGRRRS